MALNAKQQRLFDTICERIAKGESLVAICLDAKMPNYSTVTRWLAKDEGGDDRTKYALAREAQADYMADVMLAEARCGGEDDVQRARLIVDTMKWVAAKLKPKRYGDKLDVKHSGDLTIGIKRNERLEDDSE